MTAAETRVYSPPRNTPLSLAASTNTYTLTFITDAFNIPYNANVIQNAVTSRNIGFSTATVPYGSFTANLSAALAGAICPYTVTVQSPTRTVTNTFTVQATRTKSNLVQLTDISASVAYIYTYTTTQTYADSTLSNWLNSNFWAQGGDSCSDGSSGSQAPVSQAAYNEDISWTESPWYTNPPSKFMYNYEVFTQTGQSYCPPGADGNTFYTQTPQAQININNANISALIGSPTTGSVSQGSTTVDCGTNFTITSNGLVSPPPISPVVTQQTHTANLTANVYFTGNPYCWDSCSRALSIPITYTQVFTGQTYPEFQTITVKFPLYDSIVQVLPSTIVQSWSQSTNTTDYILSFVMVLTTNHITGVVATLQLGAETGTVSTYIIGIN